MSAKCVVWVSQPFLIPTWGQPYVSKKHPLVYISNEMFEEMGQPLDLVVTVEPEKEATR